LQSGEIRHLNLFKTGVSTYAAEDGFLPLLCLEVFYFLKAPGLKARLNDCRRIYEPG
jgi:hypothetical protein